MKFLISFLLFIYWIQSYSQLRIDKIEPPNWWTGMKWDNVQLMIYGQELNDLEVFFDEPSIKVIRVHELKNTNYAFIDIEIPEELDPGEYNLNLRSGTSAESFLFPVHRRKNNSNPKGFSNTDIVYLITPDRFANGDPSNDKVLDRSDFNPGDPGARHGGDIQGMIDHLDYIQNLGFTAIWSNPLLENNQPRAYHGYAWTDLYNIDKRFGDNELFREFVDEAHKRNIKVIFDHINNHIGIEHPWMKDLPMNDWINGSIESHYNDKHHMITIMDPHRSHSTIDEFKTFWFVDAMPDINQNNSFVSNYYIQNTLWWIEFSGIAGIREDTYPYAFQQHSTDWATAIFNEYPDFNIVGEVWHLQPAFLATFQDDLSDEDNGTNMPSLMDFPLMHSLRQFIKGEGSLYDIYTTFALDFVYKNPENLMVMMDNHDEARGIFLANGDDKKVKLALQIIMTCRGIPQILYGTEINLPGGRSHVELRQDFPGGFPYHKRSAFHPEGRSTDENQMHDYLKKLISLRKSYPALSAGEFIQYPPASPNHNIYTYFKSTTGQTIMGIINGSSESRQIDLSQYPELLGDDIILTDLFLGEKVEVNNKLSIEGFGGKLYLLHK